MNKVVLASGNPGKIREIQAIQQNLEILPQSLFNIAEPEETGSTFIENAIIKARNAASQCLMPVIADDSGLVVDALAGEPGVISARYAGKGASDSDNIEKLLLKMRDIPEESRTGRFICVMVYLRHILDPAPIVAQGVWEGRVLQNCQGSNGFGYDPIFWLDDHQCSAAEMSTEQKNAISHRGQALRLLIQQIPRR